MAGTASEQTELVPPELCGYPSAVVQALLQLIMGEHQGMTTEGEISQRQLLLTLHLTSARLNIHREKIKIGIEGGGTTHITIKQAQQLKAWNPLLLLLRPDLRPREPDQKVAMPDGRFNERKHG